MSDTVYNSIPNTKNILSTLVNNINKDEIFQKNVNILSNSINEKDIEKANIIKSTIKDIKLYNTKKNPLFLARDIGILLGISGINVLVKKFDKGEKIIGFIKLGNKKVQKTKKVIFLNRRGLYRCFFTSRSPLARLFTKYLGDMLDHMFTYESKLLDKISKKFQIENPELIEKGLNDLHDKLIIYEKTLVDEQRKNLELETKLDEGREIINKKEQELVEIDTINSFNMMMIQQLKVEKENNIKRMRNMKDLSITEKDSVDYTEMKLMKEKFMKPVQLYLLHPDYFLKLLEKQKKKIVYKNKPNSKLSLCKESDDTKNKEKINIELNTLNNVYSDSNDISKTYNSVKKNKDIDNIDFLISSIESYKTNFECIFSNAEYIMKDFKNNLFESNLIQIDNDELLYFYFTFGKKIIKTNDMYLVGTKWVIDKKHIDRVFNVLYDDMSCLTLDKTLYKTSLCEIDDLIREEFMID
jgi:hypothetical protein